MLAMILAVALMQQGSPGLVTVAQGTYSGIEEARETVVRTQAEWLALWKAHGQGEPPAAVDFGKEMIAVVFLGTRPTGGYSVQITGTSLEEDALVIDYVEQRPGGDAIVSQALTSPFHIVRLPRHEGPVRFRRAAGAAPGGRSR
jgi:hypothetical protein